MEARPPVRPAEVTDRQREVARLVAEGKTNPEIAEALHISLDGAKYHVSELLGRLGLQRREEIGEWYRAQRRGPLGISLALPLPWLLGGVAVAVVTAVVVVSVVAMQRDTGGTGVLRPAPFAGVLLAPDWTYIGEMPGSPLQSAVGVLEDGRVLIAGGWIDSPGNPSAEMWLVDPKTGDATRLPDMLLPRFGGAIEPLVDGQVVLGASFGASSRGSLDLLDLHTHEWSRTPSFGRAIATFAIAEGGAIVVAVTAEANVGQRIRQLDPGAAAVDDLDAVEGDTIRAVRLASGEVAFVTESAVLLVRADGSIRETRLAPVVESLHFSQPVALADGRLLLIGGLEPDEWERFRAQTEAFGAAAREARERGEDPPAFTPDYTASTLTILVDPATGTVVRGPALPGPRPVTSAALLGDGRVLVVGGVPGGAEAGSVIDPPAPLLIDLERGTVEEISGPERFLLLARSLPDGSVFVLGLPANPTGASVPAVADGYLYNP